MTIKLWGGLGNQLFQYAFAYSLWKKTGFKPQFNTFYYLYVPSRRFLLNEFSIANKHYRLISPEIIRTGIKEIAIGAAQQCGLHFSAPAGIYTERQQFTVDTTLSSKPANTYFIGFWQHPGYFSHHKKHLIELLELPERRMKKLGSVCADLQSYTSIAVHVRRGDYLRRPDFGICTQAYYDQAIKRMRSKHKDARFVIFSDDVDWVRSAFAPYEHCAYAQDLFDGDEVDEFMMMRSCRHYIIANSTFSWWGAWSSLSRNPHVIAPRPWQRDNPTANNIVPTDWETIDMA